MRLFEKFNMVRFSFPSEYFNLILGSSVADPFHFSFLDPFKWN